MDGFFFALCYISLLNKDINNEALDNVIKNKEENNHRFQFRRCSKTSLSHINLANNTALDDTDNKNRIPIRRQSWSIGEHVHNKQNFREETRQTRWSGTAVSIFDGTEEEKWRMFGVYVGSDSEKSDSDSDYDTEIEQFSKIFMQSQLPVKE